MRASFTAIRAIETALGKSIVAVINQIGQQGDLSFTDAATIIHHGLRGNQDTRLSLDDVGDAVLDEGLGNASVAVVEFLSIALNGVTVGKPVEPETAR